MVRPSEPARALRGCRWSPRFTGAAGQTQSEEPALPLCIPGKCGGGWTPLGTSPSHCSHDMTQEDGRGHLITGRGAIWGPTFGFKVSLGLSVCRAALATEHLPSEMGASEDPLFTTTLPWPCRRREGYLAEGRKSRCATATVIRIQHLDQGSPCTTWRARDGCLQGPH